MIAHLNIPRFTNSALCAEVDPELFYPEPGGNALGNLGRARKLCRSCDARSECLSYALDNDEAYGIWGGLTPAERRRVRRWAAA